MNAPTGTLTGDREIDLNLDNIHRMRSDILDYCADIEQSIIEFISKHDVKGFCPTAPLGRKIEVAKSIKADHSRSKELKAKTDNELCKLEKIISVRADIVHSRMTVAVTTDGQFLAIFKNSKNTLSGYVEALIFNENELESF